MAKRPRVRMNDAGVRRLLNSDGVVADHDARVKRIAAAAGPGFEGEAQPGRTRASGMVRTVTAEAALAQARDNALLKALDAGR